MARRNKKNKSKKQKDLIGVVLILGMAGISIALLILFFKLGSKEISYDQQTLCPKDPKNINSHIAILIDGTEEYNSVQLAALDKYLSNFINNNIVKHDKISIYAIDDKSYKKLAPVIELCNPGTGENINPLIGNPEMAKKKWAESFNRPLTDSIKNLFSIGQSEVSPIMEMIQAVAIKSFPKDDSAKKLFIISDMIQNTPEYSQYKNSINFESFSKTPYYKHVYTNLNGADISLLYLLRSGAENMQNRKHIKFWEDYINSLNGQVVKVENIEG
jgi:hypothetical protein